MEEDIGAVELTATMMTREVIANTGVRFGTVKLISHTTRCISRWQAIKRKAVVHGMWIRIGRHCTITIQIPSKDRWLYGSILVRRWIAYIAFLLGTVDLAALSSF